MTRVWRKTFGASARAIGFAATLWALPAGSSDDLGERIARVAADQILMLPGERLDGQPPPAPIGIERIPDWSSTVGGVEFTLAQVLTRLLGPGAIRLPSGATAPDRMIHWVAKDGRATPIGTVELSRPAHPRPALGRLTPSPQIVARRNAVVGQALLASFESFVASSTLRSEPLSQPARWKSPPATPFTSPQENLLHLAARGGTAADPILRAMMPIPDTPGGRHDRWTWIVHLWSNPLRKPVGDSESYRDYRAAQREGVVRPISIHWRDEHGMHSLHLPRNRASRKKIGIYRTSR